MGHDEDKNNFDTGGSSAPSVNPNPRAAITGNNRLGMRPSRNVSNAQAELDRISKDSNPNKFEETGDIVLNNSVKKKSPKIIILIALLIVTVIVVIVSVIVTKNKSISGDGSQTNATKKEINELLVKYSDNVKEAEEFILGLRNSEMNASMVMQEDVKNDFEKNIAAAKSLRDGLKKYSKLDNDDSTKILTDLKNQLYSDVELYEKIFNIYNDYYRAIVELDKTAIESYLAKGQDIKNATEAYIFYIDNKVTIDNYNNIIVQSGCQDATQVPNNLIYNCVALYNQKNALDSSIYNYVYLNSVFKSELTYANEITTTEMINNLKSRVEE